MSNFFEDVAKITIGVAAGTILGYATTIAIDSATKKYKKYKAEAKEKEEKENQQKQTEQPKVVEAEVVQ